MKENGVIVGRDGQPPIICWSFDGCRVHKGKEIGGDLEIEDGVADQLALSEEENEDKPEGAPASEESDQEPQEASSATLPSTDED